MVTIRAANTGETIGKISALQIASDNIGDDLPIKTVLANEPVFVNLLELIEMRLQQMPEGGVLWLSGMIHPAYVLSLQQLSSTKQIQEVNRKKYFSGNSLYSGPAGNGI